MDDDKPASEHWRRRLKQLDTMAATATAAVRYGLPAYGARIIVTTGETGILTPMTRAILKTAGHTVATLHAPTKGHKWEVQKELAAVRRKLCDIVIISVPAHATGLGAMWGLPIAAVAVCEAPAASLQAEQFRTVTKLLTRARELAVLDINGADFVALERSCKADVQTYGDADLADTRLVVHTHGTHSTTCVVETHDEQVEFHIPRPEPEALVAALAAITLARFYDVDDELIQSGLFAAK
ncbi:MAG: hypothetical protein ACREGJ_04340 [Candidatus Saccharimonadales bacterium]